MSDMAAGMDVSVTQPLMGLQSKPLETALASLHYIYPATVFVYFIVSSLVAVCTLSEKQEHRRRGLMLYLMLFSVLSYLAQIATILVPSAIVKAWLGQQDAMISLLSCILVFGLQLATLSDSDKVTWYPYIGPYLLALVFEPALEIISLYTRGSGPLTGADIAQISVVASRYLAVALTVATYFASRDLPLSEHGADSEHQPLLPKTTSTSTSQNADDCDDGEASSGYGATTEGSSADSAASNNGTDTNDSSTSEDGNNESSWERRERKAREDMEKRLKENGNWIDYSKRFLIFFPYIWPVKNRPLQLRALLVGVCLLANNALNVFIPRQLGIIMDSLSHANTKNPWVQVIIFAFLKFLASEAGLSLLRQWLWVPVEFYSFDAMSTAAYSHVLNLSSDFHDSKSSSDIMMAISSGQSVSNLLESICFSAIPMLIDMCIAFAYLSATFGPYEGFITLATAVIFLYIASRMISVLKNARRSEVSAWFEEHYVRQAGIQGWSTVTSFNQVSHEEKRYSTAVKTRVAKSQAVYFGYLLAYAFQYLVLLAGLLAGAFLAVWQVTSGQATPGQFIMLLTYWTQLVAPLTFFASLGKNISRNFIHAEQLLDIMTTKPTIINKENAPELVFSGGAVEFENVTFSYNDKKSILKDISFFVEPGMTIAFVGATGAGKSTILKLLDRFYDVKEGAIKIDGQDVREVDIYSLRSRIGIVPQSPILFNDTVMNNVRYAKLSALDEEVYEACRAACIHDQILGFSDGYNTMVGERGVKLSGGELQRVAIARAILKNPSIVLLDEATSSVDTETEQKIQEALHALCHGRTTFVVAHRLSTVMNADCIIVVADGEIVEKGGHDELIMAGGKYAALWSKQVFSKAKDKAKETAGSDGSELDVHDIFNDLSPELASNELKKAQATEAAKCASNSDDETVCESNSTPETKSSSGKVDGGEGCNTQTEAATCAVALPHEPKKEVPRLNPIAPTFTPRAFGVSHPGPETSVMQVDMCSPSKMTSQPAVSVYTGENLTSTAGHSRIAQPSSSCISDHSRFDNETSTDHQRSTEATELDDSAEGATEGADGASAAAEAAQGVCTGSKKNRCKADKVRWSRPRYSRRIQSKSEPSSSKTNDE